MRAAVAQAEQAGRIVEHFENWRVVARYVVHHREIEILALAAGDVVVGDFVGRTTFARSDRGDALFRRRLVIRRVAHDIEPVPLARHRLAELRELGDVGVRRRFGENLPADFRIAQPLALFRDRQRFKFLVARPHRERIERGADAHHDADRPAGDLRGEREALRARRMRCVKEPPPALRVFIAVGEQEPHRPSGLAREPGHPGKLIILVVKVAVHAESAHADCAERRADPNQLVGIGVARRHQFAVGRLVRIRARGGKTKGAALQRLDGEPAHLGNVIRRRGFAPHRTVAHDIDAKR